MARAAKTTTTTKPAAGGRKSGRSASITAKTPAKVTKPTVAPKRAATVAPVPTGRPKAVDLAGFGQRAHTLQRSGWTRALRGVVALVLAILLASSSVFRLRLPRRLRLGAFLEGEQRALRAMQSGHPGDYVLWITIGLAVFGSAALFLLRG